jgi:hypothetical protein
MGLLWSPWWCACARYEGSSAPCAEAAPRVPESRQRIADCRRLPGMTMNKQAPRRKRRTSYDGSVQIRIL